MTGGELVPFSAEVEPVEPDADVVHGRHIHARRVPPPEGAYQRERRLAREQRAAEPAAPGPPVTTMVTRASRPIGQIVMIGAVSAVLTVVVSAALLFQRWEVAALVVVVLMMAVTAGVGVVVQTRHRDRSVGVAAGVEAVVPRSLPSGGCSLEGWPNG